MDKNSGGKVAKVMGGTVADDERKILPAVIQD